MDRIGAFVGHLFIEPEVGNTQHVKGAARKTSQFGENVGLMMVSKGLATVHEASASRSSFGTDLLEAEKQAKASRTGIWSVVDPNALKNEEADVNKGIDLNQVLSPETKQVIVSNIADEVISVQVLSDGEFSSLIIFCSDVHLYTSGNRKFTFLKTINIRKKTSSSWKN